MGMPAKDADQVLQRFDNIIKPNNDTRLYRGLVLTNQLKVVLVSDATTDKSAASLSVKVGSLADPWQLQGMAHFLEHALFLTTKKVSHSPGKRFVIVRFTLSSIPRRISSRILWCSMAGTPMRIPH